MTQREMLQIVDEEGNSDKGMEPALTASELLTLYRTMVYTRVFDNRMVNLQRQGRIAFYAPCVGEEAAHIGSAYALSPDDWLFPQYREQGAMLLRGMTLEQMASLHFGRRDDACKGRYFANAWGDRGLKILHASSPVGTQIPIAVGTAMAAKIRGDRVVSMVYFGDGATSSAYFHVGLNFASVFHAPVVFVCKNNQYAISVHVSRQSASKSISVKAGAYGLEGRLVDGNDILAVYRAAKDAVDKARRGEGPTLIEAYTYRMGPHSTSDDPSRYRSQDEVESWSKKDPITRFHRYLENKNIWGEKEEREIWAQAEREMAEAIRRAEAAPPPNLESMFEDVYKEIPESLREQMQDALRTHERLGAQE